MPSRIGELVFSEPSGRLDALVMFSGSLVFLGLYVYSGILGGSSSIYEVFLSVGFAVSGIAESLPKDRRRTAGIFRVTAILVLTSQVIAAVFAPEFVLGPR